MSFLLGAPKPQAEPVAPTVTDPSVAAAAQAERVAGANALGAQSTILTGGQGDTAAATIAKKTLLGG